MASWPGFTIHSLVRRCIGVPTPQAEYQTCRAVLLTACCRTWNGCDDSIDFRRNLSDYISHTRAGGNFFEAAQLTPNGLADSCIAMGTALKSVNRLAPAASSFKVAHIVKSAVFGKTASETMAAELELGKIFLMQSLLNTNPVERNEFAEKADQLLKPLLEYPEGEIRIAAASWDVAMLPAQLKQWPTELEAGFQSISTLIERSEFRSKAMEMKYDESSVVIAQQHRALEIGTQCLGQHDPVLTTLRFNIVRLHVTFGRYEPAKEQLENILANHQQSLGKFDGRKMQTMEMLAYCHLMLQDPKAAAKVMQESCQLSHASLWPDDPRVEFRDMCLEVLTL